jgi:pterin-4a-carbinolamine dehydratase
MGPVGLSSLKEGFEFEEFLTAWEIVPSIATIALAN